MNRKRNVNFIKPDDPPFLRALKIQAGYDDKNHKFDELHNKDEDFVSDDDSELPQVIVLKKGDLTAEEADVEKEKIKKIEAEKKADLSQRVVFKAKKKLAKNKQAAVKKDVKTKTKKQLLSFNDEHEDDDED